MPSTERVRGSQLPGNWTDISIKEIICDEIKAFDTIVPSVVYKSGLHSVPCQDNVCNMTAIEYTGIGGLGSYFIQNKVLPRGISTVTMLIVQLLTISSFVWLATQLS